MARMTRRKKVDTEEVTKKETPKEVVEVTEKQKAKSAPRKTASKKKAVAKEENHPEFRFEVEDNYDIDTKLVVCSNNGSDKGKTLYNAKIRRMPKPILIEIQGLDTSYKFANFSLSVDEARELSVKLNEMADYLEI